MRSAELKLEHYDTDKVANRYFDQYDRVFAPFIDKKITLLELGVYKGGSLLLWRDYFPQAEIVGVDLCPPQDFKHTDRMHIFQGSQTDTKFLSRVAGEVAPDGFEIIIDDASHIGEYTKTAFWHLFDNHLKPGGIYAIEDWGTGYWDDWPDGKSLDMSKYDLSCQKDATVEGKSIEPPGETDQKKSWPCHSYGMVGLVKQLIDEQGAKAVTRASIVGKAKRSSKFAKTLITPNIVFITKAGRLLETT